MQSLAYAARDSRWALGSLSLIARGIPTTRRYVLESTHGWLHYSDPDATCRSSSHTHSSLVGGVEIRQGDQGFAERTRGEWLVTTVSY